MNNEHLIIRYEPFSETSTAWYIGENQQASIPISSNLSTLAESIAVVADRFNTYSVKLDADPAIVEEIKLQLTTTNYSKEKIDIEGI